MNRHLRRIRTGFFWTSICFGSLVGVIGSMAFAGYLARHHPAILLTIIIPPVFVGVCYMVGTEVEWRRKNPEGRRYRDPRG